MKSIVLASSITDDRLENDTTVPGNPDKSGAIAYALYLAIKFWPKWVVVLHKLDYSLIKLPQHYSKSLSKLVVHIESIIEANEKYHGRKCEEFYIGKSTTVKPPNKGHFGDRPFVPCREVVLFSEVLF